MFKLSKKIIAILVLTVGVCGFSYAASNAPFKFKEGQYYPNQLVATLGVTVDCHHYNVNITSYEYSDSLQALGFEPAGVKCQNHKLSIYLTGTPKKVTGDALETYIVEVTGNQQDFFNFRIVK